MNAERDQAMTGDFEPEQKRYLEGFVAGLQIAKTASNMAGRSSAGPAGAVAAPLASPGDRLAARTW